MQDLLSGTATFSGYLSKAGATDANSGQRKGLKLPRSRVAGAS